MDINVITKVKIGERKFIIKGIKPFFKTVANSYIEGSAVHMKIMAYGARDLLIDKILAYKPLIGKPILKRIPDSEIRATIDLERIKEPIEKKPFDIKKSFDFLLEGKGYINKRSLGKPANVRLPFLGFKPLNKKYLARKVADGKDPRMFLATGDYVRGIVIRKEKKKDGIIYELTMAHRTHISGIPLGKLAKLLEYGKKNVPPRPHWLRTYLQIRELNREIGNTVRAKILEKKLKELV